jgi:cysteine-rich repeat protein
MRSYGVVLAVVSACGFTTPEGPLDSAPSPDMTVGVCGDRMTSSTEECDDGNTATADGCAACQIEPAWQCPAGQPCVHVTGLALTPRETLPSAGSSGGGGVFSHPCAARSAIVGFDGKRSNGNTDIGRLRATCAVLAFAADGRLAWSVLQNTPYEANEDTGDLGVTQCAPDSLVVGYIANAGQYLSGLRPLCAPVSFVHGVLVVGAATPLPMFGPATQQLLPASQCAAGEATAAFEGAAGAVLDHFNLKCFAPMPLTE